MLLKYLSFDALKTCVSVSIAFEKVSTHVCKLHPNNPPLNSFLFWHLLTVIEL